MFSGNEFVFVVVVVVIVAAVVAAVVRSNRRAGAAPVSTALVRGSRDEVVRDLTLALSGQRNTTVRNDGTRSLTVERSEIPVWAIVVAILAFPIGLLALLARSTVSGTVWAEQTGERVELHMGGSFNGPSVAAVNAVIDSRS